MERLRRREQCRICRSADLTRVLPLSPSPLANALEESRDRALDSVAYPLDVHICNACGLVQLVDVVDPTELFSNYPYATGASTDLVRHFDEYADAVWLRTGLKIGDLVVEFGSNDGTLLQAFMRRGARVIGVDPARNLHSGRQSNNAPTVIDFFGASVAKRIRAEHGAAKVIVANNVLAHIDDLDDVMRGVDHLLAIDGTLVVEVSHLLRLVEGNLFELVYHEHLSFFSLETLSSLVGAWGMGVVAADSVPTQGGSLRVQIRRLPVEANAAVAAVLLKEAKAELRSLATYERFMERFQRLRGQIADVLGALDAAGRTIAGYGASARATTFLSQISVAHLLRYVVDDSTLKQGRFMPGSGLEVRGPDALESDPPHYCLVFAWNFASTVMDRARQVHGFDGGFILPFPGLSFA